MSSRGQANTGSKKFKEEGPIPSKIRSGEGERRMRNNGRERRRMTTVEGEVLKNKITQGLFRIKKVEEEEVVMLEDEKGFAKIWLPKEQLESLFEKIKGV